VGGGKDTHGHNSLLDDLLRHNDYRLGSLIKYVIRICISMIWNADHRYTE
jgi:hypothetical protein